MRLFVFGYGYSSAATVRRIGGRLTWIGATTRSADKAAAMRADGIEPFFFDGSAPGPGIRRRHRPGGRRAGLGRTGRRRRSGPEPARRGPVARPRRLRSIVYLSTVGVYGRPSRHAGRRAVRAEAGERAVRRARRGGDALAAAGRIRKVPIAILRLSGIYGPGRNAFVNLADGTAKRIVKPGQVFNRIHVDDIAQRSSAAFSRVPRAPSTSPTTSRRLPRTSCPTRPT